MTENERDMDLEILLQSFKSRTSRGWQLLEKIAGIDEHSVFFWLKTGKWRNWFVLKKVICCLDLHYEHLLQLHQGDPESAKRMYSGLVKYAENTFDRQNDGSNEGLTEGERPRRIFLQGV